MQRAGCPAALEASRLAAAVFKVASVRPLSVVKADAYGLGADRVAPVLAAAGAKPFGARRQLDSGMNRLGMEPADWACRPIPLAQLAGWRGLEAAGPITLVMSHLACADEPDHPMNAAQLRPFAR
jgi:alanine racemase